VKGRAAATAERTRRPRVPQIVDTVYRDGLPVHQLQYLQVKLILHGERFTSARTLRDFDRVVAAAAAASGVDFDPDGCERVAPQLREVLFLDTPDFRLYRNAFILRRRLRYEDGFLVGDPEIVFKYRHADLQRAAEVDVRPRIAGDYRVKFKAEALPLRQRLGGVRMLYSHNVQFPLSAVKQVDRRSMATVVEVLPALRQLQTGRTGRLELVNNAAVEEILLPVGRFDFGKHVRAKASVALWRTRGDLQQLVGEFSFQLRFRHRREIPEKVLGRCERFYLELQRAAADWIALGTTKTGTVYALHGHVPETQE
jgi:hypothetical protein